MTRDPLPSATVLLLASGPVPLLLPANVPVTNFYVVVINDNRHGVLLGPYVTTQEATDMVPVASTLAEEIDSFAWFYRFAVKRLPSKTPGRLMSMLERLPGRAA